jgi:hypothetical protein
MKVPSQVTNNLKRKSSENAIKEHKLSSTEKQPGNNGPAVLERHSSNSSVVDEPSSKAPITYGRSRSFLALDQEENREGYVALAKRNRDEGLDSSDEEAVR